MEEPPTDLITEETIATYLAGPPQESADFDFLLGEWACEVARFDERGKESRTHRAVWRARPLASGRIVFDETISFDREGREIASMATLRTYSPGTARWEMTFLLAHQPALPISFTGQRVGNEMWLEVRPAGVPEAPPIAKVRFFDIAADRFEWEQHTSFDGGVRFRRTVSIHASRTAHARGAS